jgi:predicted nucleic acid-binding protein
MLYYLDSSAWVKRYFDEAGSGRVRHLFAQHEILCCSPLGLIEVGSTMARKRTAGEVRPEEFEPKWTSLLKDWRRFLRMEMTPAVVQRALDASDTYGLRAQEFTFVTSDEELKAAAAQASLLVVDPQQQPGLATDEHG